MKKSVISIVMAAAFLVIVSGAAVFAGDAMDDLEDMKNTGETFDGSDGQRSGMDIDIDRTGDESPAPTPEAVDTSSEE